MNPRLLATRILMQVIFQGKSLNACVAQFTQHIDDSKDRAMARELVSGVLRLYERLDFLLSKLLTKPLREKDSDVYCLMLVGLYQIFYMRVPDHAAVSETVKLTQKLKKSWAKGFLNGVLRQSLRDKETLIEAIETEEEAKFSHPAWLVNKIKTDWPDNYESIFEQNLQHSPMILRVNRQKRSAADYLVRLEDKGMAGQCLPFSSEAIRLEKACDVLQLPGFKQGEVSVQDQAAQLAAGLLDLEAGLTVLDACSAPGGKTAHMLETEPGIDVLALDVSEDRLKRVDETLTRLSLKAKTCAADAFDTEAWWNGELFDRILLDAPCSAIGVIRRNPDIKIHRNEEDIAQLVENQRKLLDVLWQTLKPGGILLYATCSILKDENENQITDFLRLQDDAIELKIKSEWGTNVSAGKQILPGENGMDGFYYACISKVIAQ
ncbi:MAG: 16S rRNA (cytosine(967)-C(5))-methyltransferase RsmB [Gammaproteobacteria bacterium]|nr:16S rRNA (cytosine(967)-C(5))-methyltransferase RsmB [Gammaproteobacteria bacterium]